MLISPSTVQFPSRCKKRGWFVVIMLVLAMLVSQGTAQLTFGPEFHLSQCQVTEAGTEVIRLSAPILTRPQTPAFTGSIEVDITAEDLPGGNAKFGSDYIVNRQNPSSRNFTVTFQSKQANSSENVIVLADDDISEGNEAFRLRIAAARFIGEAAAIFIAPPGLTNTVANVIIEDNDFIEVSWIISEPIEATEGEREAGSDGEEILLELFAQAFGLYASPIAIGVVCAEVIAAGVPPAYPDRDFEIISGSTLEFTDVETLRSNSSTSVVLSIIDDHIAEPCESFICTLQGDAVDRVRGIDPNRVTVRICDDDELQVRWATDVYVFDESQVAATVELVTDSTFEVDRVSIQGFPRQIPNRNPNRFPSLVVPGPVFPGAGFAIDATIERVFVSVTGGGERLLFGDRSFGNAQVTQSGRSDAVNTINDFVFTPNRTSMFENFTIVDDDVLEFDELFIAEFSFGSEIANNWNARKREPSVAFIRIIDDDSVVVNFNEDSYTVTESGSQVNLSLRIDGKFFVPVWVIIEIRDGTAKDPEDYSSAKRYNVTFRQTAFTDGDYPAPFTLSSPIIINIMDDAVAEGVEYFQARIVETSDRFRVWIGQDTVNVTITDNVIPQIQYEEEWYRVQEETGYVTLALVLKGNTSVPVTVTVRTLGLQDSSAGATPTSDYIPKGPTEITFPPGIKHQLYRVTIVDDNIPEDSEFFTADIVSVSYPGFIIGSPKQPLIEILDFLDVDVSADFSARQYESEEGGQLSIYLSVTYLTSYIPDFTGSIEVEIIAEDLPRGETQQNALFGIDYIVNPQNPSSRTFTVTFQPKQLNATEHVISISDDDIFEDKEHFRLRIHALRFIGEAANRFRAQPGVTNSFAEVAIKDNDIILVNWTVSDPITVTEGEGVTVELFGEAFGIYATPIAIGVVCAETVSTNVNSAIPGRDFNFTTGAKLYFTDIGSLKSKSLDRVIISIINDDIAEPCKSFICTLQGGAVDAVRGSEPNRITIEICDDDPLIFRWARDVFEFEESEKATVELVTDSKFEVTQVVIQGFPRQIPDGHPFRLPNLVVPGPAFPGFAFDATIEQAVSYKIREGSLGNAQVTQSGRADVVNIINDFIFTPANKSAFTNFTIVDDDVLEFDELFIAEFSFCPEIASTGNAIKGEPSTAFILIRDDDFVEVNFNEDGFTVAESDDLVSLSLRINGRFFVPVWAIVDISDGTATDPEDYTSTGRYNVTFRQTAFTDGEDPADTALSSPILIDLTSDDIFEGVEYFQARIVETSDRFKVRIGQDTVNVTITDTIELTFNPTQYSVSEGDGDVVLTLLASHPASFDYTVHVDTVNGTAVGGLDFQSGGYQATFLAGETTASVSIPITDDTTAELTEDFSAVLTIPATAASQGTTKGEADTATAGITDDDPVEVVFNPTQYSVNEGDGVVTLTLNADKPASFEYTVEVLTQDGTATGGSDYAGEGFSVAFPIGDTVISFNIAIVDDDVVEATEHFSLHLEIPDEAASSGITIGTQYAAANITIVNDDGSWSPWLNGNCSTLPCGGVGVRTDVRLCTSPTPSGGRVHCRGKQWRNTTCFTCPCGGGWSSWSEGVCSENRQRQRVREDSRICTTPDHPDCCPGLRTRISPCPASAVHGGWSAWNVGYCSKSCGGSGVRTDWRACNSPPPMEGGDHCHGPASRTMPCYTCPCGGGWSNWVEGTCSKTCGLGTRLDRRSCTTPDHQECCPGCGLRQSNCSVAKCPVHGGWSSWLEATSCSVSCGGGTKFLVRECNEPVPAHGGNDCDGVPYRVQPCNTCPCDAGWSSWVPGACGAPCGQNGTAVATRKCRGPSECCPGEGKRTELCTSPPCQGR